MHRVADLAVGGLVQITESIALLAWLEDHVPVHAQANFGLCGISMGAEIATLYAAVTPIPTHVVAVMPAHSAIAIWHEGVLGDVSDWTHLAKAMADTSGRDVGAAGAGAADARGHVVDWLQHTDIRTFAQPYHWLPREERPNVLLVGALDDAYIPAESTWVLAQHWKDIATCRWLPGGHCTTVVLHKKAILEAIVEVFEGKLVPLGMSERRT